MTIAERINAERVVLAGWSRAILLQLAHPLVAQGVADHSSFSRKQGSETNAERRLVRRSLGEGGTPNAERAAATMTAARGGTLFSAAARLHHTVQAMRHLTFGDAAQSRAALDGILAIHRRVNGTLADAVGPYPAGTPYSAEDPSLVLWVHATLLDSLPRVYEAIVGPISDDERDAWCRESAPVARALGGGDLVPETWAGAQAYISAMLASGRIVVSDTARDLAADVLAPRFSVLIAPWRAMNRVVTMGLLPPELRAQYGFPWSAKDDATLARTLRGLRTVRRLTPDVIALWPDARRAR
ncbi:hypothetical protein LuPra_00275 [Luteitalea pratensis]|uniref:ER-bound oxygenase mpaB/mpaB'/Rubber oxygenase catalytic domain-containing protein n=1 Tax=Luteitalea pratensis TaxID=1855912 RepID=A0A143PGB2_LUTPR|nr:oxygenase MpaB family protein [Luteitalea pratensis]AMY07108.1 hypothetical protein LuPra_00275 [Luteitalea pratensis]